MKNTHPTDPLTGIVNVRLTAAEKSRLQDDAAMASLTMSELIRRRFFGRSIVAKADDIMIREVRRLGGMVKHLHNESNGAYSAETAAALKALRLFIEGVTRDSKKSS